MRDAPRLSELQRGRGRGVALLRGFRGSISLLGGAAPGSVGTLPPRHRGGGRTSEGERLPCRSKARWPCRRPAPPDLRRQMVRLLSTRRASPEGLRPRPPASAQHILLDRLRGAEPDSVVVMQAPGAVVMRRLRERRRPNAVASVTAVSAPRRAFCMVPQVSTRTARLRPR